MRGWPLAYKLGVASCNTSLMCYEEDPDSQDDDGALMMIGVISRASSATIGMGVIEIGGPLLVM